MPFILFYEVTGVIENAVLTYENDENSLWSIAMISSLSGGVNWTGSLVNIPSKFDVSW